MNDYFREPKKVRTRPELEKSCRMLREHNEKLKASIAELEHDIDQYREIDKDMLKRIAVLEYEVDMWRKHVPELEATIKRMEQSYLEGVTYEYYKAGEAK